MLEADPPLAELSNETKAPATTLTEVFRETEIDDSAKPHRIPDLQKQLHTKCYFKPLSPGIICYVTIDN